MRRRARLTQSSLAAAAGLTRGTVSHLERGRKRLSFDEACRIADALGISLEQLRPT